jgi:hypothetical protein
MPGSALLSQGGAPTPIVQPPTLNPVIEQICGFPVLESYTGKLKVMTYRNGRTTIIFPGVQGTWTNALTGTTVTRSITGTFHQTTLPNGNIETVFTGNNAVGDTGENFFVIISGRFTQINAPDGSVVQPLTGVGKVDDMCALLA